MNALLVSMRGLGLLSDHGWPLVGTRLGIGEHAFGVLVGPGADLLGLAARLGEQRLAVSLGLLGLVAHGVGLLHALANPT